jgi:hypothetical protein
MAGWVVGLTARSVADSLWLATPPAPAERSSFGLLTRPLARKLYSWEDGCMKTTVDLPDELVVEIKVEAARQRKKLRELVPELLRAGLDARRSADVPEGKVMAKWLDEWVALGASATRGLPSQPTASEILAADRGRLERR